MLFNLTTPVKLVGSQQAVDSVATVSLVSNQSINQSTAIDQSLDLERWYVRYVDDQLRVVLVTLDKLCIQTHTHATNPISDQQCASKSIE